MYTKTDTAIWIQRKQTNSVESAYNEWFLVLHKIHFNIKDKITGRSATASSAHPETDESEETPQSLEVPRNSDRARRFQDKTNK